MENIYKILTILLIISAGIMYVIFSFIPVILERFQTYKNKKNNHDNIF